MNLTALPARARIAAYFATLLFTVAWAAPSFATSASMMLQAPMKDSLDCVKGALKKNHYGLDTNNAGQPSRGPGQTKAAETVIGIRRLHADEISRYASNLRRYGEARIDYGLARMNVGLSPNDARATQINFTASILVFMTPGIPLMGPSRLFTLRSNGGLEDEFAASLRQSKCAAQSAPSPALR
jgi:hypothetical protein